MTFADVAISEEMSNRLDDGINFYRSCSFCGKESLLYHRTDNIIAQLLKSGKFYCAFCIRHDHQTKKSKHVLLMSFKGIIAHLYYNIYLSKESSLYIAQILDMVDDHAKCGLLNPAFSYDSETFNWFVDFSKIGDTTKKRVSLDESLNTVHDMLSCFNLYSIIKDFKGNKLAAKYDEALIEFYRRRYRPADKRILMPTLSGCIDNYAANNAVKKQPYDLKQFKLMNLKIPSRR